MEFEDIYFLSIYLHSLAVYNVRCDFFVFNQNNNFFFRMENIESSFDIQNSFVNE